MDFINLISVNVVVNDYNNYLDEKITVFILFLMLTVPIFLLIFEISGVCFEKTLIILSAFFILSALLEYPTIYTGQKIKQNSLKSDKTINLSTLESQLKIRNTKGVRIKWLTGIV